MMNLYIGEFCTERLLPFALQIIDETLHEYWRIIIEAWLAFRHKHVIYTSKSFYFYLCGMSSLFPMKRLNTSINGNDSCIIIDMFWNAIENPMVGILILLCLLRYCNTLKLSKLGVGYWKLLKYFDKANA